MNSRALRIVHVVSSLQGGGMERFVLRLAESQRQRGHDAAVVAIKGGPLLDTAVEKGVPVKVLRDGSRFGRVLHTIAHLGRVRPQIIHCHNPTSLHYATIAKLAGAARLVFTDHAQTKGIIRVPRGIEWRLVDAYAAVSAETARHAIDIGYCGRSEVVHNGVEFAPPARVRAEVRVELGLGDGIVCVNVASFFPVKAQDVLVRAAGLLKAGGVGLVVVCVGDGAERRNVERLAGRLGLGPAQVRFLGFRYDVPDLLAASDLFALPSRAEGFPLSLLEAMSHRLPVVCTDVGGNTELVGDGQHGFVVPANDPGALADAMARIAADADLRRRMGDSGRARVLDEFSFDRTTDRYQAIYHRVLAGAGGQVGSSLEGAVGP